MPRADRSRGSAGPVTADELAGAAIDDGVQADPAVPGVPDLGHVQIPQFIWPDDADEPRPPVPIGWATAAYAPA